MEDGKKAFILVACDATPLEPQELHEVIVAVFEHLCSLEGFSLSLPAKVAGQPDNPAEIGVTKLAIDASNSRPTSPNPFPEVLGRQPNRGGGVLGEAIGFHPGQPFEEFSSCERGYTGGTNPELEATISGAAHGLGQMDLEMGDHKWARWSTLQGLKAVLGSEPL